jgi:tRNA (guanosine-2'-O-)-methyltransferase
MTPERQARIHEVLRYRQNNLTVVLENVHDPHNISAVMRSCDAVGISEIYVLNNRIARHKKYGDKSSSSASKWMLVHQFTETEKCFEALRAKYHHIYSTHLSENAKDLYQLNLTESVALVFGNESEGITEETLKRCDGNFIIPQMGIIQSLNISVACAVSIYEAMRQKRDAGHYAQSSLEAFEQEALLQYWNINLPE